MELLEVASDASGSSTTMTDVTTSRSENANLAKSEDEVGGEGLKMAFPEALTKEDTFVAGVLAGIVLAMDGSDASEARERLLAAATDVAGSGDAQLLDAASSALEKLKSDLSCSVCFSAMRSPISLQCGHSFCLACIAPWLKEKTSCPVCRCDCLSYRSYQPNVALRDLMDRLGMRVADEEHESTRELLEELDARPEREMPETPVDPTLLNEIRVVGRVRSQGTRRHPFQHEIRISLREREQLRRFRAAVRSVFQDSLLQEIRHHHATAMT
ncbi:E3 ubiquitin-protein ligase TRIM39 [Hondaea fermentalgiana]|uniref:E3 ubiquitin-protein ligase TRIM39 n=1 Tax=Hondaea fermentalgiana TaxID=2315210 RepID=A0A2R5H116_9STRA|nr:E3 ubiquitin-protein ligase TRIM39 [Hondaea fermentalgiana]|eukprot:GBG34471.1 E3 ubiquitin-protein ligase TRIM39 [Hondaea fermentalgiana]